MHIRQKIHEQVFQAGRLLDEIDLLASKTVSEVENSGGDPVTFKPLSETLIAVQTARFTLLSARNALEKEVESTKSK